MTFGFTQEAGFTSEAGAPHKLIESGWLLTELNGATEAKISGLVRKVAG
jgi:hypothetical protein